MQPFGSPWVPFGIPGGVLGLGPRMSTKSRDFDVILESILAIFSNDFSVHFFIRFFNHFWNQFGAILGAKMEPKSIKHLFKIRSNFCVIGMGQWGYKYESGILYDPI